MATVGILIAFAVAGVMIAKLYGVDPVEAAEEGLQNVKDQISGAAAQAGGELGIVTDPVSLALPIIKAFEGFSPRAYADPPGQSVTYSIGYGHQISPGDPYTLQSVISADDADQQLRSDVASAYACVTQNVTVDLSPTQAAALISFVFNIGCGAFEQSTLLQLLNSGDYDGAAAQFPQWIHAGGAVSSALVDRRSQEQGLFLS